MRLRKQGRLVEVTYSVNDTAVQNSYNWKSGIALIPEGFRPYSDISSQSGYDNSSAKVKMTIRANGDVSIWCSEAEGGTLEGTVTYFAK